MEHAGPRSSQVSQCAVACARDVAAPRAGDACRRGVTRGAETGDSLRTCGDGGEEGRVSSRVLVTDSRWRSLDDEPTRVIGAHQASSAPPSVISLDDTRRASISEVPAPSRPASPPRLDQSRGEVPPAVALGLVGLSIGRDGDGCGVWVLWTAPGGVWAGTRGWTIDTGVRAGRLVHRARARRAPGPLARRRRTLPYTSVSFLIYKRGIHDRLVYLHYPCIETSLAPPRRRAPLLVCPIRSARPLGIGAGGP